MLMTTCMKINQCASPAAGRLAAVVLFLAVTGPVVGTTHAAVISSSVRLEATTAFGGNQDFQSVELQQAGKLEDADLGRRRQLRVRRRRPHRQP